MNLTTKYGSSLLLLAVMIFSACSEDSVSLIALDAIALEQTEVLLDVGEVQQIVVGVNPENATEHISWDSSDESVAQIQFNESGRVVGVKGVSLGDAILKAKNADSKVIDSVYVKVIIKVASIRLEEEAISDPAQTKYLVVFTPNNPTIQDVEWSSSNSGVATVSSEGIVTAVEAGIAQITATTVQGGKSASVDIIVSGNPPVLGFVYCSPTGTGSYNADTVITQGGGTNLNHKDGQPSGNYKYYEEEVLTVAPGGSFDLLVEQSNNWSMTAIWVDWNGDKDFIDSGEQVQVFGVSNQLNNGPFNAIINVPSDAIPGRVRMRVLTGDAWTTDPADEPCGEIANGTIKDFTVDIVGVLYCSASGTGSYNLDTVVTTGAVNNINYSGEQPSGNYEYYSDETLKVSLGNSFNMTITQSNNWSITGVWIDWNADGDFEDADEQVQVFGATNQLNDGPFSTQIRVPNTAILGNVRMRILTGDAWTTDLTVEPCGEIANSTIKDFNIEIL